MGFLKAIVTFFILSVAASLPITGNLLWLHVSKENPDISMAAFSWTFVLAGAVLLASLLVVWNKEISR